MIHPSSVVSPKAVLDPTVSVGPFAVIEDNVTIGANTSIGPHAIITGYTQIGQNNEIHMGSVLGHLPQDVKFDPQNRTYLHIGDYNVFREYCTIHRGTESETATHIGSKNYLMGFSHVAHNCHIGNQVVICNGALVAGHSHIQDQAFISGYVLIHQNVHVGRLAMFSGAARVSKDVPPFMMACERNEIWSINLIGIERSGMDKSSIREIKKLYRIFYRSGLNVKNALINLKSQGFQSKEVEEFIDFVEHSPNGVLPHKK